MAKADKFVILYNKVDLLLSKLFNNSGDDNFQILSKLVPLSIAVAVDNSDDLYHNIKTGNKVPLTKTDFSDLMKVAKHVKSKYKRIAKQYNNLNLGHSQEPINSNLRSKATSRPVMQQVEHFVVPHNLIGPNSTELSREIARDILFGPNAPRVAKRLLEIQMNTLSTWYEGDLMNVVSQYGDSGRLGRKYKRKDLNRVCAETIILHMDSYDLQQIIDSIIL